jgi:hypothetical protein
MCNKTNAYFYKNGQLGIILVHQLYSTVFVDNIPLGVSSTATTESSPSLT